MGVAGTRFFFGQREFNGLMLNRHERENRRVAIISATLGFVCGAIVSAALIGSLLNIPGAMNEDIVKLRKEVGLFKFVWRNGR